MVVCIPRLLAVVSLKKYAARPPLYMGDKKVNTAELVYKYKRIVRTYYTLDIYPSKNNRSIS